MNQLPDSFILSIKKWFSYTEEQSLSVIEWLIIVLLILFQSLVVGVGITREPWGDEAHFIETARLFTRGLTTTTLLHYDETITPLSFILYSIWGRLFNVDIVTLRIFSIVIAIITYLLSFYLFFLVLKNRRLSLVLTALLAFHAYMIGFSIFVFTDMPAILFLLISCIAIQKEKSVLLFAGLTLAVLCRQYLLFLTVAAGIFYLFKIIFLREMIHRKMLIAVAASCVPIAFLFVFWGGLSPINEWRAAYQPDILTFHPEALTLYIFQCTVYVLPLVWVVRKKLYGTHTILTSIIPAISFYWFFPIKASPYSSGLHGVDTVGLFHKFIRFVFGRTLEQWIFFSFFALSLPLLFFLVKDFFVRLRQREIDYRVFLELSVFSFLLIMPFSYFFWEKYFMPLVPILALLLTQIAIENTSSTQSNTYPANTKRTTPAAL